MQVKLQLDITQRDVEVLIRYPQMNRFVKKILVLLRSVNKTIQCDTDKTTKWVNVSEIYYIESVDKRTFVYCENAVYRTDLRLYQLMDELGSLGFVQISKSCLLNINVLESIRPLFNSRMEAHLKNGERLYITRKYLADIRSALQEGEIRNAKNR